MTMGSKVPRYKIACALCTKNRLAKLAWQSDSLCKSHNGACAIVTFDPYIITSFMYYIIIVKFEAERKK